MKTPLLAVAVAAATLLAAAPSHAADPRVAHSSHGDLSQEIERTRQAADLSSGEIRKIDRDQRKITLRHGEIKNLEMPPMTMVFQVADPAWIEQFKVGDKVAFRAASINGAITLTELKPAP